MMHQHVSRIRSLLRTLPFAFWSLCAGTFINRLGMFIKPFLAIYLTSARHLPAEQVGLILGLLGAGSLIASVLISIVADRFSRKHLLVFGLLASAALLPPIAFLASPFVLALVVLAWSILNEAPGRLSRMLVIDIVKPEQRRQAISLLRIAINIGLAISTALGGIIATIAFFPLFLLDAGTTVVFALVLLFQLPSARKPSSRKTPDERRHPHHVLHFLAPLRDYTFLKVWLATFFVFLIFSQLFTTFATYVIQQGGSPALYGGLMTLSASVVLLEFPLMVALSRVPGSRLMMLGCLIAGIAAGLCTLGSAPLWLIVPVLTFSLAEMLVGPSFDTVAAELAPPEQRGAYQGTLWLANGLGNTVGPVLGGILLQRSSLLCWMVFLVIGLLAAFITRTIPSKTTHKSPYFH